ncbi:MAG TPA: NADH:ubiquinone oxidoreductase subunit N, partial [Burkholderiales bacterium]
MNETFDLIPLAPEIFVFGMACVILLVDLYRAPDSRSPAFVLTQLTLIGAAVLSVLVADRTGTFYAGTFVADPLATLLKLATYGLAFFVFAYSRGYLAARGLLRSEYFALGLLGIVGMMVLASASHFLTLYLGLELLSLSLYAMVALQRDS